MPMEGFLLPRTKCSGSFIAPEEGLAHLTGWGDLFQLAAPGDLPKRLNRRSAMAVKYKIGNMEVLGPPYTKAEEANFYRRQGVATMFTPKATKAPRSEMPPVPDRPQRRQGKQRTPRHPRHSPSKREKTP
jgi:hypothetical protein